MKYAFFLDIDGSFLSSSAELIEENIKACEEAIAKGHYVFLCTGRPLPNITEEILKAVNWSGIVSALGAVVEIGGRVIREVFMSEECSDRIGQVFEGAKAWLAISNNERTTWMNRDIKQEKWDIVSTFEEYKKLNRRYCKLTVETGYPEEFEKVIEDELHLYIYEEDGYAEAVVKGISKASGIELVLKELGLSKENAVAVGDSANDLEMIKYAGIGVAMGNAPEAVKKEADIITATNDECGVAKIIREITG